MPWLTWEQAAGAAAISGLAWGSTRRLTGTWSRHVCATAAEVALIFSLYAVWRLARMLPVATAAGAIDRARDIVAVQDALHLPSELALQHFVLRHDALATFSTYYYAIVHMPALLAFLIWLFVRHRDAYPHWRNGLALVTLACLLVRFVRVAPPRFLPDLGYVDLSLRFGVSVYSGDVNTGISDQFAAMPSIHVAWAAVVSFGVVAASTSRWRWLALLHVVLTMLTVAATGNHWWLDGVVAVLLLLGGLRLDTAVRRQWRARAATRLRSQTDRSPQPDRPSISTEPSAGTST